MDLIANIVDKIHRIKNIRAGVHLFTLTELILGMPFIKVYLNRGNAFYVLILSFCFLLRVFTEFKLVHILKLI